MLFFLTRRAAACACRNPLADQPHAVNRLASVDALAPRGLSHAALLAA